MKNIFFFVFILNSIISSDQDIMIAGSTGILASLVYILPKFFSNKKHNQHLNDEKNKRFTLQTENKGNEKCYKQNVFTNYFYLVDKDKKKVATAEMFNGSYQIDPSSDILQDILINKILDSSKKEYESTFYRYLKKGQCPPDAKTKNIAQEGYPAKEEYIVMSAEEGIIPNTWPDSSKQYAQKIETNKKINIQDKYKQKEMTSADLINGALVGIGAATLTYNAILYQGEIKRLFKSIFL